MGSRSRPLERAALLLPLLLLLAPSLCSAQFPPQTPVPTRMGPTPAIRIRLNRGLFEQASYIASGLVERQIQRVAIPSTQQCFTEGCVQIQNLRIVNFRQPQQVAFMPLPPNQMALRLTNFDFYITGNLGGSIQVIIQFPVGGTIYVTGRGLSVSTTFDLQKSRDDEPYLRMLTCSIDGGTIEAKVQGMGIFTDTVNNKYSSMMSLQTRRNLQQTLCRHMQSLIDEHFSERLRRLPTHVSVKDLANLVISGTREVSPNVAGFGTSAAVVQQQPQRQQQQQATSSSSSWPYSFDSSNPDWRQRMYAATWRSRQKRQADDVDYLDEVAKIDIASGARPAARPTAFVAKRPTQLEDPRLSTPFSAEDLHKFFNVERMRFLVVDVSLLDASATNDDFSIGIAGSVSSKRTGESPYPPPYPFRLPPNPTRRQAEVIVSSYTINSLFYHAHRTNALLFHIDSSTPGVGSILKTTCSVDEICISDQIEEIGLRYPGKNLELIIRTLEEPVVEIENGAITMKFSAKTIFFIQGSRKKVGSISFTTVFTVVGSTKNGRLIGTMEIKRFVLHREVDFFGLDTHDLEGFRQAIMQTLERKANATLRRGIPLSGQSDAMPIKFNNISVDFLRDVLLLQANLDLYNTLFSLSNEQRPGEASSLATTDFSNQQQRRAFQK